MASGSGFSRDLSWRPTRKDRRRSRLSVPVSAHTQCGASPLSRNGRFLLRRNGRWEQARRRTGRSAAMRTRFGGIRRRAVWEKAKSGSDRSREMAVGAMAGPTPWLEVERLEGCVGEAGRPAAEVTAAGVRVLVVPGRHRGGIGRAGRETAHGWGAAPAQVRLGCAREPWIAKPRVGKRDRKVDAGGLDERERKRSGGSGRRV